MKTLSRTLIAAFCCLPSLGISADFAEKEILHATFVAFQQPGVLDESYIDEKRQLLQRAAREGNAIARMVVDKRRDNAAAEGDPMARLVVRRGKAGGERKENAFSLVR